VVSAILDPAAFSRNNEERRSRRSTFGCYCSACSTPMTLDGVLENPRYLLLAPTTVDGFVIATKKWSTCPIRDLQVQRQEWNPDILDPVCLDKQVQMSLKEGFAGYFDKRRQFLAPRTGLDLDLVSLHMSRLVVHFHGKCPREISCVGIVCPTHRTGPQGLGKLRLASWLGLVCQRPLIDLRPADLGMEIATLNKNLSMYSDLSLRWGAILLL